jgi:hypothetical protein
MSAQRSNEPTRMVAGAELSGTYLPHAEYEGLMRLVNINTSKPQPSSNAQRLWVSPGADFGEFGRTMA